MSRATGKEQGKATASRPPFHAKKVPPAKKLPRGPSLLPEKWEDAVIDSAVPSDVIELPLPRQRVEVEARTILHP